MGPGRKIRVFPYGTKMTNKGKTQMHAWYYRDDTSLIISSVYSIMFLPFTRILGPKSMW